MLGLSHYESTGGALPGGLLVLEYIPIYWIGTFPSGIITDKSDIELVAGKSWLTAPILPKLSWQENQRDGKQGVYYDENIVSKMPNHSTDIETELSQMSQHRYVIIAPLRNGKYFLIGSKSHPLTFSANFGSGDSFAGYMGHSLQFRGEVLTKAIAINV